MGIARNKQLLIILEAFFSQNFAKFTIHVNILQIISIYSPKDHKNEIMRQDSRSNEHSKIYQILAQIDNNNNLRNFCFFSSNSKKGTKLEQPVANITRCFNVEIIDVISVSSSNSF